MKRCEKCGAEIADDALFCTECGEPVKAETTTVQDTAASEEPEKKEEEVKAETPKEEPEKPEEITATQPDILAAPKDIPAQTKAGDTAPVVPPTEVAAEKTPAPASSQVAPQEKPKKKHTGLVVFFVIVAIVVVVGVVGTLGWYLGWFDQFLHRQPTGIAESFDNPENATFKNIYVGKDGQVKAQGGELLLSNAAVQAVQDIGTDYVVKVKFKFISVAHKQGWAGIIIRISPEQPTYHYAFQLFPDADKISISKVTTSAIEELKSVSAQIEANYDYYLQVNAKGKDFSFSINGQKFLDLTDISLNTGGVGLEAYYSQALFDDFSAEPTGAE
jgi:predicted nucleic acid-binding Zn ribbon protein